MTKITPPDFKAAEQTRSFTSEKLDYLSALAIDPRLKPSDFRVAFVLVSFRNAQTGLCCPAVETVAELVNLSERQVENCLKALRTAGWLRWRRINRQKTNRYEFLTANVSHMLDRRISIDEARRERRKMRHEALRNSPQKWPSGKALPVRTGTPLQITTRSEVPTNTFAEHRNGTSEVSFRNDGETAAIPARLKR